MLTRRIITKEISKAPENILTFCKLTVFPSSFRILIGLPRELDNVRKYCPGNRLSKFDCTCNCGLIGCVGDVGESELKQVRRREV